MRRFGTVIALVMLAACGGTTLPVPTTPFPSVAAPSTPAATASSIVPVTAPPAPTGTRPPPRTTQVTIAPPATPTLTLTATATRIATPEPTISSAEPPAAVMAAAGSEVEEEGKLGSYTFGEFASDAPWLPARILGDVTVGAGMKLLVRFPNGTAIADWSAQYAAAADERGSVTRALLDGRLVDGAVEVTAPPAGDWAVVLDLDYPANQGSGSYFWHVTVTP